MADEATIELIRERLRSVVIVELDDGMGSGFYVSSSGLIVTSAHVIGDRTSVTIRRLDRSTAKVKVVRVASGYDLALLWDRSLAVPSAIPLADPTTAASGMSVYAIGHPAGLEFTVTRGIVSAVNRVVKDVQYVQTDAAAHPGSSGGPILDPLGNVLGVSTFGLKVDGLSFALSVRYVRELVGEVVLPVAPAPMRTCSTCGVRNKASRRVCRRCSAPTLMAVPSSPTDPTDQATRELTAALAALEPPATVSRGGTAHEVISTWRGDTVTIRVKEGELRFEYRFDAVALPRSMTIVMRGPPSVGALRTALEALADARNRLAPDG